MTGNNEFVNGIPLFLRREAQPGHDHPPPGKRTGAAPATASDETEPTPRAAAIGGPGYRGPSAEVETLPRKPRTVAAVSPRTTARKTEDVPVMGRPELVVENGHSVERDLGAKEQPAKSDGDCPFQVTLPRELVHQIRVRAAEEDTTHRAIILRSLKHYGFSIPDGEDVDRRKGSARRG